MVHPKHLRRLLLFAVLLGLGLMTLGGWLYWIQILQHARFKEISENYTQRVFLRDPRRGDILDTQGHPLAMSLPVKKVYADPSLIGPYHAEVAQVLAPLLGYDAPELALKLRPVVVRTNSAGRPVTNSYVNLRRQLSVEQWQQVTQTLAQIRFPAEVGRLPRAQRAFFRNLRLHSIYAHDDQRREYPNGRMAAHVLGFTQEIESEFNSAVVTQIKGVDGIERWMDSKLCGVRGWIVTEADRRKREIVVYREQNVEPRPGLNVVLTLDLVVQHILESELTEIMKTYSPESAMIVVTRPRTGEILGLAVAPDYDPNQPGSEPADHRRNRFITDLVEPGSTFKIVVVAGALNDQVVNLHDVFFCENGTFMYCGYPLRDHGAYGHLSVLQIITKSSNIGAAKIGLRLGAHRLYYYVRQFGFGSPTGLTLPGEIAGIARPVRAWDKLTVTRIPMGHSIAVTPLQMVLAMNAIANDGVLMKPMLIQALTDAEGRTVARYQPAVARQVVSSSAARDMVTALKTVPTKDGTALKAALDYYTVAGKTGTAQVPGGPGGYLEGIYVASFIGFFPADNPEVLIGVFLNKLDRRRGGYYGGQTAAPHFQRTAEQIAQYLKIRPDREDAVNGALASALGKDAPAPNPRNQ